MNSYEERQAARRERLERAADKAQQQSDAHYKRSHEMASVIPMGQPILVGHHSEGRDRRYRDRIGRLMDKSIGEAGRATELRQKATSVGEGGISSDDPDAIAKLRERLAELEAKQTKMKRVNAYYRKHKTLAGCEGISAGLGTTILGAMQPWDRKPYPSYATSNNNGNMRRIRERITHLDAHADDASSTTAGEGFTIGDDVDENRVMVRFDEIPPPEIRTRLKRAGFKWSPTRGAWVRMRSPGALAAARYAMETTD